MRVGFLGIGLMGLPMARNLLQAGHRVSVWNRSLEKAEPLRAEGAAICETPRAVAAASEVLFTMLSDGKAVAEVLKEHGAAAALGRGNLVIDTSSIAPAEARENAALLAKYGVGQLDAPVSGGPSGAEQGSLAIMVGGTVPDFTRALPLLQVLGRPTHVGPAGAGQLAKLANQIIVGLALGAVAEGLLLASAGGADPAAVRSAMKGGLADSLVLQIHGERMLERRFLPGGPAAMHLKDLNNVMNEAEALGLELPIARLVRDLFAKLVADGPPGVDHSGILLEIERINKEPPRRGHRLGSGPDVLPEAD